MLNWLIQKLFNTGQPKLDQKVNHQCSPTKSNYKVTNLFSDIHPDIKDMLWVANGPMKNYDINKEDKKYEINSGGFIFTIETGDSSEPSLIDTSLPIEQVKDIFSVERPGYYPTYKGLYPEQKSVYLEFLKNPYDDRFNVGYAFILYYGLERHLLKGNYEKAFKVILKLRKAHKNGSFQGYTSNALILSCLRYQRADLAELFIKTLREDEGVGIDLLMLCKYSLSIPLTAREIMSHSREFDFKNTNYIKKYPELFEEELKKIIKEKYSTSDLNLTDIILKEEEKNIPLSEKRLFANLSIADRAIKMPSILKYSRVRKGIYLLLETAHNNLKVRLAVMRKEGKIKKEKKEKKVTTVKTFDSKQEKELIGELERSKSNPIDRHFAYMNLHEFYYSYRELEEEHIKKCIQYCLEDIKYLDELNASYKAENGEFFDGRIIAFKRLAIIYEKMDEYEKAIEVSLESIKYGQPSDGTAGGFAGRIEKLRRKQNRKK